MAVSSDSSKLNVAVVGAGIGGLTVTIALLKHPNINVTVYEQATELREIGASIALGPNGLRTLEKLGINNALNDEIAFRQQSGAPMIYRHWKTNEILSQDLHHNVKQYRHRTARYLRAHLQEALLANVPAGIVQLGKRLTDIQVHSNGAVITFADGTTAEANLVIGADGIHSAVRKVFAPEHQLNWTGWVAYRSIFDAALVEGIKDLPVDSTHWWGPNRHFFASRLGKNKFTVVGGFNADPNDPEAQYKNTKWDQEGDVNLLREYYKDWNDVVRSLVNVTPTTRLYPNVAGAILDRWTWHGRVTVLGDAAHTHGGAFAAGGSLAIDDAYAFYLAISSVFPTSATSKPSPAALEKALALYEATRQPHTSKVLTAVHNNIEVQHKRVVEARKGRTETDAELRERTAKRSDPWWIHEHDVEAAFEQVLASTQASSGVARL